MTAKIQFYTLEQGNQDGFQLFMNNQYLTAAGLEDLKKELKELKTIKRQEVAAKISAAKDLGDLSENAEYQSAKEEMSFMEGRIQQLEEIIKNAVVITEKRTGDMISIGSTVFAASSGREVAYRIVGSNEADPRAGRISNESPLGQSFLGKKVGDEVTVKTPVGETVYTILKIE